MTDRDLDVVVHGATGFVGRLVAERLAATAPSGTRIALSGRSADRVRAVRDDLGPAAADWPVLVADSHDGAALADLAARTRAVASTVGPYAEHGTPLVLACAAAGTSYADLTGEATFVRESIDAAHARAADTGARIVHSAGFDSVPSDLAVLLLADAARTAGAGGLANTTLVVGDSRGGLSGGTIASLVGQLDAARTDARAARLFAAPASLDPGWAPDLAVPVGPPTDLDPSFRSGALGGWVAPWVMAPHNARIVRRSAALAATAGTGYGPAFRYREVVGTGGGPVGRVAAAAVSGAVRGGSAALGFGPVRALVDRVLPAAGSGPSDRTLDGGRFSTRTVTRAADGSTWSATVAAQLDPGYRGTAVMLAETVLALALDVDRLPDAAGVLTPATGVGTALVDRLRAAGMTMTVEQAPSRS